MMKILTAALAVLMMSFAASAAPVPPSDQSASTSPASIAAAIEVAEALDALAPCQFKAGTGEILLAQGCCRTCRKGKACGNSCINRNYTCRQPPGCACNG